jgi:hypothetical protein
VEADLPIIILRLVFVFSVPSPGCSRKVVHDILSVGFCCGFLDERWQHVWLMLATIITELFMTPTLYII